MLAGLRHHTVGSSNNYDSTVHLSGTSNHVLYIVSVARAVNVSIVTILGLILNVSGVDSNTALLLLGGVVDRVERTNVVAGDVTVLSQHGGNSSGQGSFTVVNVTNSTDVNMRFCSFKMLFCHNC